MKPEYYTNFHTKFRQFLFTILLFSANIVYVSAQQYLHLNDEISLRFEQQNYSNKNLHLNIKPYITDSSLYNYDDLRINSRSSLINNVLNDNLIQTQSSSTVLTINPIVDIAASYDMKNKEMLQDYKLGISANLKVGKRWFLNLDMFYGLASFNKTQSLFIDSTDVIFGYGKILSKKNNNFFDYYNINGYVSYNATDFLNLQAGIGKNFLGEGYRSLLLSDNAGSYPFLKASVDIWKFKYMWLLGVMKDADSESSTQEMRTKLLFSHYLSWNATEWLNINFFEAVVSNPVDSVGVDYFNINYLNPVIFFRPTEFAGGSADNALVGVGATVKISKTYKFYTQLMVDEFKFSELKANSEWWANKYGIQAGVKIFNLANVENLFARLEYNMVRPYTYSHSNSIMSYGNHYQPLAHAEGANFEEFLFHAHYFKKRYSLDFQLSHIESGRDFDNFSYGQNIFKPYTLRKNDYGNKLKQGYLSKQDYCKLTGSYILNPKINLALQMSLIYKKENTYMVDNSSVYFSIGIRTLLANNFF